MRRTLGIGLSAAMIAAPLVLVSSGAISSVSAAAPNPPPPANATTRMAGPQHWCGTNGITCAEPDARTGTSIAGYDQGPQRCAHLALHRSRRAAVQFYSNRPGSGNNVTYQLRLPKDPPTPPKQDGSGGNWTASSRIDVLARHAAVRRPGLTEPGRAALDRPCDGALQAGQRLQHVRQPEPEQPSVLRPRPRPGLHGDAVLSAGLGAWPAGIGCTAKQWCAALNIDTFQNNANTGTFNNTDCLNTVGPEPVNFAFLTKNGVATAPGEPAAPGALRSRPRARFLDEPRGPAQGAHVRHRHKGSAWRSTTSPRTQRLDDGQRGQRLRPVVFAPERRLHAR